MTFIVCQPLPQQSLTSPEKGKVVRAGIVDTPDRMVGDINLFLSPYDDDEDENSTTNNTTGEYYVGEVDIMVAHKKDQGKGTGKAAVLAFLGYLSRHADEILGEYTRSLEPSSTSEPNSNAMRNGTNTNHNAAKADTKPMLYSLMAKINQTNERSIALFKSLGFEQEGEVNFFGEIKLVLSKKEFRRKFGITSVGSITPGYEELVYARYEEEGQSKA